jgi:hypothetical protein
VLSGDIKVVFYVRDAKKKILQFWFNTMVFSIFTLAFCLGGTRFILTNEQKHCIFFQFVRRSSLILRLADLDGANKNKNKQFVNAIAVSRSLFNESMIDSGK